MKVEWKKLGEICEIRGRIGFRGYTRADQVEKGKGALSLSPGNIMEGCLDYENTTFISWEKYEESPEIIVEQGDIIFCKTASVGKVAYIENLLYKSTINPQLVLFKKVSILPKFLYYILLSDEIQNSVKATAGVGSVPNISQTSLAKLNIPIPLADKQKTIVNQLDAFTSLIASLESELDLRKKQFEHYRNKLYGNTLEELKELSKKGLATITTLSEIGTFQRGRRFVRTDIKDVGIPCIHYGDMYTYYGTKAYCTPTFLDENFSKKLRYAENNDVVIVGAGENDIDIGIGVAWLGKKKAAVHDACYIYSHKENPIYIAHYLRTNIYHQQIKKYVSSGKICSIPADGIGKAIIPLPPLSAQQSIVEKLDAFEQLVVKLKEEIALRKKQYEYYREKLLTFE